MSDPAAFGQLLQNPAVSQMMQNLLSNPQNMEQVLQQLHRIDCYLILGIFFTGITILLQLMGLNPQLRSMLDTNPQLREMMQNPELIRQLTSSDMLQVYPHYFCTQFF